MTAHTQADLELAMELHQNMIELCDAPEDCTTCNTIAAALAQARDEAPTFCSTVNPSPKCPCYIAGRLAMTAHTRADLETAQELHDNMIELCDAPEDCTTCNTIAAAIAQARGEERNKWEDAFDAGYGDGFAAAGVFPSCFDCRGPIGSPAYCCACNDKATLDEHRKGFASGRLAGIEEERKRFGNCQSCAEGNEARMLDKDGVLCSVSGEPGILTHAHEEYYWPCIRALAAKEKP